MTNVDAILFVLGRNRWFGGLPDRLQRRIVGAGTVVTLEPGQWVHSQGDPEAGLEAVIEGALRLEVALDADRDVLIGFARRGSIIGQTRRAGGGPRILTTRANYAARVLVIGEPALERIAADEPDLWRAVSGLVYEQLTTVTRIAAQTLALPPRQRVAARIGQLAENGRLRIRQEDLAEMTGLSRKSVNGHLAALEAAGLIRRRYAEIAIENQTALHTLSDLPPARTPR